jgi:hypothetical protein
MRTILFMRKEIIINIWPDPNEIQKDDQDELFLSLLKNFKVLDL